MEKLTKGGDEPEKQAEKVKEIIYHETIIDETTDDMNQNLTDGRWLPLGTDLPFYQTKVPKVSGPLRTNYALEEIGLTPSRFRGIHMAHSRADPSLLLKMYRPENITRTEDVKTWAVAGGKFKQSAEEADITDTYGALRALMNYFLIRKRVCPGDFEPDTLFAAVFILYFDNVLKPSGKDIAALFVRWQGRRASTASVGQYIDYKWCKDNLKDITDARLAKIKEIKSNINKDNEELEELGAHFRKDKNSGGDGWPRGGSRGRGTRGFHRGGGGHGYGGRGGGAFKQSNKRENTSQDNSSNKKSRQVAYCNDYNGGQCSRETVK